MQFLHHLYHKHYQELNISLDSNIVTCLSVLTWTAILEQYFHMKFLTSIKFTDSILL